MQTMIQCKISQIGKANPADQNGSCFHIQKKEFSSFEEAFSWLEKDYGIKKPKRIHDGNAVFEDTEGGGFQIVGFMNRRWVENYERRSGQPKNYWEENWITFSQFQKTQIDLKQALN